MPKYADPGPGQQLPPEVWEDLLDDACRRWLLAELVDTQQPARVVDLAAELVDCDQVETGSDSAAVREQLFQHHLPKLTATDVVRYDSRLGTLELTSSLSAEVEAALE